MEHHHAVLSKISTPSFNHFIISNKINIEEIPMDQNLFPEKVGAENAQSVPQIIDDASQEKTKACVNCGSPGGHNCKCTQVKENYKILSEFPFGCSCLVQR